MSQISVLIPAYQHAHFIVDTLESVFSQSIGEIEVIVVNDGSPDSTALVLDPYVQAGRIRYYEQQNQGQSVARNFGLKVATGEFVLFLDDDDLLPPDKLERQVNALRAAPEAVGSYGGIEIFHEEPTGSISEPVLSELRFEDFITDNKFKSPGAALLRRSAVKQCGGFACIPGGADDWDFWLRITKLGPLVNAGGIGLFYRVHQTNASSNHLKMLLSSLAVCNRHHTDLPTPVRRQTALQLFDYVGDKAISKVIRDAMSLRADCSFECARAIVRLWALSGFAPQFYRRIARACFYGLTSRARKTN